jgi:uncharacterized protein (TIGR02147 family)
MRPNPKKYLNIFQFLQDCYQQRKSQEKDFSYELWARELQASDKSYVRLMVLGKRPLNDKMIAAFAENLNLDASEKEYFTDLTHYTQSKSPEQKKVFGKKLIHSLKDDLQQLDVSAHYEFLSNPLLPRLQVMLSFQDLDQSAQSLSWLLGVPAEEIESGLQTLLKLKLIEDQAGLLRPLKSSFKVSDHFGDLGLEAFYTQNLEEAQKAMQLPAKERRFKSLFLPLNIPEFDEFLGNLQGFVREQLVRFNPDTYADRKLYQVHMNIIPVSTHNDEAQTSSRSVMQSFRRANLP